MRRQGLALFLKLQAVLGPVSKTIEDWNYTGTPSFKIRCDKDRLDSKR